MSTDEWRRGPMAMDPKLDAFRLPPSNRCWWCGDIATTEEHRIKRSTLRRIAQSPDGEVVANNVFKKSSDFENPLHSINKGAQVRWRKNLCANCNNSKSQPFDLAYDAFDSFVVRHIDEMMQWNRLDWSSVYGNEFEENARNLARYFAKQMGCMLATQRLPVPQDLVDFLNGAERCPTTSFMLYIDSTICEAHFKMREEGVEGGMSTFVGLLEATAYETDDLFSGVDYGYHIGYMVVRGQWLEGTDRSSWFEYPTIDLPRTDEMST